MRAFRRRSFLALGFIAALAACRKPSAPAPPPPVVSVVQPVSREIIEWDEYISRLESPETVEIRARVSGYLDKVHFKEGKDGRISRALVTQGNLISGGVSGTTLLTTIVSLDPLYLYGDADERAILKYNRLAREGARVSARDQPVRPHLWSKTPAPSIATALDARLAIRAFLSL